MSGDTVSGNALQFTNDNLHCYAYSGLFEASTTEESKLKFNTNSEYIIGILQLNMPVDDDNPTQANISSCNIKFNNVSIGIISGSSTDAGANRAVTQKIIIPPFTTVDLIVDSSGNESDRFGSLLLTGKVGMPPRVGNLVE